MGIRSQPYRPLRPPPVHPGRRSCRKASTIGRSGCELAVAEGLRVLANQPQERSRVTRPVQIVSRLPDHFKASPTPVSWAGGDELMSKNGSRLARQLASQTAPSEYDGVAERN